MSVRYMMSPRAGLILPCLTLVVFAHAADKPMEEFLAKMRKAYSAVGSMRCVTDATITRPGGKMTATSIVSYEKKNRIHMSVERKGDANHSRGILATDGKRMIRRGPSGDPIEGPFSLQAILLGVPINLETICFWDYQRQLSTGKGNMGKSKLVLGPNQNWRGKSWLVLQETVDKSYIEYFIDPKTYFIHRTIVMDFPQKRVGMDLQVRELKLGVKHDPKLFQVSSQRPINKAEI